ncbi:hypothetical protein BDV96DRAFT_607858 [Lophiotrema nucula]|uniref:Uncharacterized protein n=1 Tax=Lophiotrema nucula TaxID=690887 RepID=A0A6A5YEX0_9PLEO|nr:hypothetical protein BDV96DRAFT_607858 [Lophiotrema nucula]
MPMLRAGPKLNAMRTKSLAPCRLGSTSFCDRRASSRKRPGALRRLRAPGHDTCATLPRDTAMSVLCESRRSNCSRRADPGGSRHSLRRTGDTPARGHALRHGQCQHAEQKPLSWCIEHRSRSGTAGRRLSGNRSEQYLQPSALPSHIGAQRQLTRSLCFHPRALRCSALRPGDYRTPMGEAVAAAAAVAVSSRGSGLLQSIAHDARRCCSSRLDAALWCDATVSAGAAGTQQGLVLKQQGWLADSTRLDSDRTVASAQASDNKAA